MNLENLIGHLEKVEKLVSEYSGGYSERYFSAEEFHAELKDRIEKLKKGYYYVIYDLDLWFLPTSDWDDFVGIEGMEIANKLSPQLSRIKDKLEIKKICLNEFYSIDNFHSHLKKEFRFPETYGKNWDAFWDSITDLENKPDLIIFFGWNEFKSKFERDSNILKQIVNDYNNEFNNRPIIIKDYKITNANNV
ncbi:barstar family protein [Flavobacteriaceae bacterium TK19130]|nr:barstar family protein [Thermobacterium salinum]